MSDLTDRVPNPRPPAPLPASLTTTSKGKSLSEETQKHLQNVRLHIHKMRSGRANKRHIISSQTLTLQAFSSLFV